MQVVGARGSKRKRNGGGSGSRKGRRLGPQKARRRNARVAGFLGIEKKFYDTFLSAATLTAVADATGGEHNPSATICLNSVTQGDGESQRDGRKLVMKYISLSGYVESTFLTNQTVLPTNHLVYIALVLDKQTNGALLNSENVFINPSGAAGLTTNVFRNLQYIQRFQVLKSLKIELRPGEVSYDGTDMEVGGHLQHFVMNVPLNDIPVNFTGTTETIANIADNSLHVIAWAADFGATVAKMSYNARLRFVG